MNIFLSAHYDDAILSCGELIMDLPEVLILTVFGGAPKRGLTDYDKKCGFASSMEAVRSRRIENSRAALVLGAETLNLECLDNQYNREPNILAEIQLLDQLREITTGHFVYAPIGIMHPDHIQLNKLASQLNNVTYYEDMPHRVIWSDQMVNKIHLLNLKPVIMPSGHRDKKRSALEQYKSQINTGDLQMEWCLAPERYWREA